MLIMTNSEIVEKDLTNFIPFENNVRDSTEIISESSPTPLPVNIGGCVDSITFDAGDISLNSLGRILQLSVTIKNVCPQKRVALAIFLTELDTNGVENKRGMKIFTVPAQTTTTCQDITVRCINFILPEDIDASEGLTTSICNDRQFYVRILAQYIDYDFQFCTTAT